MVLALVIFMIIGAAYGMVLAYRENVPADQSLRSRIESWSFIILMGGAMGAALGVMVFFAIFGVLGLLAQGLVALM